MNNSLKLEQLNHFLAEQIPNVYQIISDTTGISKNQINNAVINGKINESILLHPDLTSKIK